MTNLSQLKNSNSDQCWDPTEEELKNMDWGKYIARCNNITPKPQRPMSKFEWRIRCFIHRVKTKLDGIISFFHPYDEI